ncbi:MAG: carbohydrate ABC transporter permease, partial [Proteobacteria bacterium]
MLGLALRYGLAIGMALVFVFPFLVMLTTAFKPSSEIFIAPPQFWPNTWTLEHFSTAITQFPFLRYLSNT